MLSRQVRNARPEDGEAPASEEEEEAIQNKPQRLRSEQLAAVCAPVDIHVLLVLNLDPTFRIVSVQSLYVWYGTRWSICIVNRTCSRGDGGVNPAA